MLCQHGLLKATDGDAATKEVSDDYDVKKIGSFVQKDTFSCGPIAMANLWNFVHHVSNYNQPPTFIDEHSHVEKDIER